MVADLLLLSVGLVFLLGGGEALVRGATAIASATGVPHLVVGLTIVAFGTSAPELAVNVWAAWRDSGAERSFGATPASLRRRCKRTSCRAMIRPRSTIRDPWRTRPAPNVKTSSDLNGPAR